MKMMKQFKNILFICLMLPLTVSAQTAALPDSVEKNTVTFQKVESEASFPGGDPAWKIFLIKNLRANIPADNGAPVGKYTVIVLFVVGSDGTVSNIKAITHLGYGMEDEAKRIIEMSGNWKPAEQNGRTVNAYRKQPITFIIKQDGFDIHSGVPYTLFTGFDNEITVDIKRVSPGNLTLMITKGSIIQTTDGRIIARINSPGRVIITVYNKKNDKQLGAASFEVKPQN